MNQLLGEAQLRQRLGISRSTLNRWVAANKLPQPVKIGSRRLWSQQEIDEFVRELLESRDRAA